MRREPTLLSIGARVDRPSGTLVVIPRYPALKRGANLGCPSGAGFWVVRAATNTL